MTEEDEVSVCAEGEGWMASAKEQQGFVKVCTFPGKLYSYVPSEHSALLLVSWGVCRICPYVSGIY